MSFRSLRNTRTRIHKNLFVAMVVQVLIRLTVYIDIEILRKKTYGIQRGIGNTVSTPTIYVIIQRNLQFMQATFFFLQPVLCEASYVLLEYAKTSMFMWMFIEGLFLHNMVTGKQLYVFFKTRNLVEESLFFLLYAYCCSDGVPRNVLLQDVQIHWLGMSCCDDLNLGHHYCILLSSKVQVNEVHERHRK